MSNVIAPSSPDDVSGTVDDATATSVRLRLAVTRIHRLLRQHSSDDLTLTQGSALVTVALHGPITLGDLALAEQVAPPTITKVVAKLAEYGFVARTVDESDRRIHRVSITADGSERLDQVRQRRTAWLSTRLAQLPVDDLAVLAEALPLLEALGSEPPPGEIDR